MSGLGRWILSSSSDSKSPDASGISSDSSQGRNRILHGRVTKPTNSKTASNIAAYKALAPDSADEEQDVKTNTKKRYGANAEGDISAKKRKKEEGDDNEDDGEESTIVAASPQHTNSEDSDEDDTDSEPEIDSAWRWEQLYLNTILNARNKFSLMPSTWRMHFRGIPLPDSLFYIKTKPKSIRPRIYARTDRLEYRGAVALRRLIDVHARIQDIRDHEATVKTDKNLNDTEKKEIIKTLSADMVKQLRRALEQALDWSRQDGGLDKYGDQLPSNVKIMELKGITSTDEPELELKIETEMCNLAEDWRTHIWNREVQRAYPPVVFGFVIIKHIITIVTMDAGDPGAIIHVPCQLHMAERNQHQWNALAILVTICWARDVALDYINAGGELEPVVKEESSDPDA